MVCTDMCHSFFGIFIFLVAILSNAFRCWCQNIRIWYVARSRILEKPSDNIDYNTTLDVASQRHVLCVVYGLGVRKVATEGEKKDLPFFFLLVLMFIVGGFLNRWLFVANICSDILRQNYCQLPQSSYKNIKNKSTAQHESFKAL